MILRADVRRELSPATHATELERLALLVAALWGRVPGKDAAAVVDDVEAFLAEWLVTTPRHVSPAVRCRLCGGDRETCGHFVGGGAL